MDEDKRLVQYFGHLIHRANSLEKTLMLGKTESRRRRGRQRMRWLDGTSDSVDMNLRMATHSSTLAWKIPWMEESELTPGDSKGQGSLAC